MSDSRADIIIYIVTECIHMFKVSDLDPDDLSNYSIDEIYSDIENLSHDLTILRF